MNYRPLGNRVILKPLPDSEEDKKIGSIQLVESAIILQKAIVMAVGDGEKATATGELIPMTVKKDDMVLVRKEIPHLPIRYPNDDESYKLVRENDIECIL